jgi:hypothetical protein
MLLCQMIPVDAFILLFEDAVCTLFSRGVASCMWDAGDRVRGYCIYCTYPIDT